MTTTLETWTRLLACAVVLGAAACGGGGSGVGDGGAPDAAGDAAVMDGATDSDGGLDAGSDGSAAVDAGSDGSAAVDAGSDGSAAVDAGSDAAADAATGDAGSDAATGDAAADAATGDAAADAAVTECSTDRDCAADTRCSSATELTIQTSACVGGRCVADVPTVEACLAGAPECQATVDGVDYVTFAPACDSAGADCAPGGVVDTRTACVAPPESCSGGSLTTYTATCGDAGCGSTSTETACPTSDSFCTGTTSFTSYAPDCSDASTCGPGVARTRICRSGRPLCSSTGTYTTFTPTCDASTGCGLVANRDDCADFSSCSRGTWTLRYGGGGCTSSGCNGVEQTLSCRSGGSVCTGARTSMTCPARAGCGRSSCAGCTLTPCASGCDPTTGRCVVR